MSKRNRDGMFTVTTHKPDITNPADVREFLRAHSPQGRIDRLRGMAAQVGVEVPELDQAQEVANAGTAGKRGRIFDNLLHQAERAIQNAALEKAEGALLSVAAHGDRFIKKIGSKRGEGKTKKVLRDTLAGMSADATFNDVWRALPGHKDVYDFDDELNQVWIDGLKKPVTKKHVQNSLSKIR